MIDLELPSDSSVLPGVRKQLRAWTHNRGWSEHQIGEIVLAVDEAFTNVIRHGYKGRTDGCVKLTVRETTQPDGIEISIRDFCQSVDLDRICGRDLDDIRPGGLGVHLIHAMMEKVEYSHAEGGGVLLVMRKSKTHVATTHNGEANAK
ncbi:MAG: ATP-binding protein [Phycisphaerae bacterium]|nr:ATP-binding protein [Phycisphaerae bacterium]